MVGFSRLASSRTTTMVIRPNERLFLTLTKDSRRTSMIQSLFKPFSTNSVSGSRKVASKKDYEYCVDLVQNRDRESYLCGLLMPHEARRSFFAIRAFNVELASIKDGSISRRAGGAQFDESGASVALKIRIQWWRDAINQIYGDDPVEELGSQGLLSDMASSCWNNPVVRVLNGAVHDSQLTRRFLERLIEAREADFDIRQPARMEESISYSERTFSSLLLLSLETTNVREAAADEVAQAAGIGLGLSTALRGARIRLTRGECVIPKSVIPEPFPYHKFYDDHPSELFTSEEKEKLQFAVQQVAQVASYHLMEAREMQSNVPRHARPCFLPAIPALHFLSKLDKAKYNIFDDSLLEQDQLTIITLLGRTWLTGVF